MQVSSRMKMNANHPASLLPLLLGEEDSTLYPDPVPLPTLSSGVDSL